jgi:hypothetical protein
MVDSEMNCRDVNIIRRGDDMSVGAAETFDGKKRAKVCKAAERRLRGGCRRPAGPR